MTPPVRRAFFLEPATALFEPWGLGDLAISLHWARAQFEAGEAVTVLCAPTYVEWVGTLSFVAQTHAITVPWTQKTGKYALNRYPWAEWRRLVRAHTFPQKVFEPRRDPRAGLLLRHLGFDQIIRPQSGAGYQRLNGIPKKLCAANPLTENPAAPPSVVCFFGAEWNNRRVPEFKIRELITSLRASGKRVGVIVPPDTLEARPPIDFSVYASLPPDVERIAGSILEVSKRIGSYTHAISTDSGWLHVAHLLGLQTLGLFGFDNDAHWSPPGGAVLRAEHTLPGNLRYYKAWKDIQPLGTLTCGAFERQIQEWLV